MLYGAGNLGRMAREYFEFIGIPIKAVVDKNVLALRHDPFWQGVALLHPDDVLLDDRVNCLLAVAIANYPYSEIAADLRGKGWRDVVMFYDIAEAYKERHPLGNGWFAGTLHNQERKQIEQVLGGWADDISRAHHLQFLAWRCLRQDWIFPDAPITTDNRFFIPEILSVLTDNEVFLDIGAHKGSVTRRLIDAVHGKFRKIVALEPDAANLSDLRLTLAALPGSVQDRIHVIPYVVGSEQCQKKFFQGLGYASQCSELGQLDVTMETIDGLELSPSFIKLHLEGGELDALKGGRNTIHRHRPLIAATSYHNRLGLWELPLWLMHELPDYSFYMRLHSWCGTGSVVYCVPKERISL